MTCYNKDARQFIKEEVKEILADVWTGKIGDVGNIHVTMNLPAMAVEFLDAFKGLFQDHPSLRLQATPLPLVHVYSFSKSDTPQEDVKNMCEQHLGQELGDHLQGVSYVRNVAPNKEMMRASVFIPLDVMFGSEKEGTGCKREAQQNGGEPKKLCLDNDA